MSCNRRWHLLRWNEAVGIQCYAQPSEIVLVYDCVALDAACASAMHCPAKSELSARVPRVRRNAELSCVQHVNINVFAFVLKSWWSRVIFKRLRVSTQVGGQKCFNGRPARIPILFFYLICGSKLERLPPEQKVVGSNPTGRTNPQIESTVCKWHPSLASRQNDCFGPLFNEFWQPIGNHAAVRPNVQPICPGQGWRTNWRSR